MFRLLGLHPGPDISVPAAASMAAVDEPRARCLLRELTRDCLITEHAPWRYTFHDLLRAYAVDTARDCDSAADRDAAIGRVLDHYLHTAGHSSMLLVPSAEPLDLAPPSPGTCPERPADYQQALAWFEAEHQVLLAAVAVASDTGADSRAWQLPCAVAVFLYKRGYPNEGVTVMASALAAATSLDDALGQARSFRGPGNGYIETGDHDQARAHLEHCIPLYQRLTDRTGEAWTHMSLGGLAEALGRFADALRHAEQALCLFRAIGHETGEAEMLSAVGWFHAVLGDYQRACASCEQALALIAKLGGCNCDYAVWDTLGYIELHSGNFALAAQHFELALGLCRDHGNLHNEAEILTRVGDARHAVGELPPGRQAWQHALGAYRLLPHARQRHSAPGPDRDEPATSRIGRQLTDI